MAEQTKIEWTDATWNPITGCSVVSPGCIRCYAMKLAGTRLAHHPSRAGLTRDTKAGPVWTGEVRFNEEWLDQPLRWKRPRMIFVCAHGDLFAEGVPDEWVDRVFAAMALAPQHVFQVLTKRAERMRDYVADATLSRLMAGSHALPARPIPAPDWPLPNVWLGVSAEDQRRADERVPLLLHTPAAVRWLSAEPLLGTLDLTAICTEHYFIDALRGIKYHDAPEEAHSATEPCARLDWVVAGGESGAGARPMHPHWPRSIRDQCAAAGTAYLFKQWGEWLPEGQFDQTGFQWAPGNDGRAHWWIAEPPFGNPLPDGACSIRVGKKHAGRRLDGVTHDGFPAGRLS